VIANQQITDQKLSLLCASNKKMRPISCPIQKLPSSLEGIFPLQNNVQIAILKSFLDSDKNSEMDIVRNLILDIYLLFICFSYIFCCR